MRYMNYWLHGRTDKSVWHDYATTRGADGEMHIKQYQEHYGDGIDGPVVLDVESNASATLNRLTNHVSVRVEGDSTRRTIEVLKIVTRMHPEDTNDRQREQQPGIYFVLPNGRDTVKLSELHEYLRNVSPENIRQAIEAARAFRQAGGEE